LQLCCEPARPLVGAHQEAMSLIVAGDWLHGRKYSLSDKYADYRGSHSARSRVREATYLDVLFRCWVNGSSAGAVGQKAVIFSWDSDVQAGTPRRQPIRTSPKSGGDRPQHRDG
jgi:hypothetical protein